MKEYLSLIKFSHTIFALPFALIGFTIGSLEAGFSLEKLVLVLCCMIFARSAAMAFNRYIDRDIDAQNPRTVVREIPSGVIAPQNALIFTLLASLGLVVTTYFINSLCFYLSPIALFITLGYSLTKRFTALCHLVLGIGLSLAPIGAYMAVTGSGAYWLPWAYSLVVMLWVAGFDIIYALQDDDFDKSQQLNSIPVWLGRANALRFSSFLHLFCAIILSIITYHIGIGWLHLIGVMSFISLLFYQHTLVEINDLSRVNMAFFTTNGIASLLYGTFFILNAVF